MTIKVLIGLLRSLGLVVVFSSAVLVALIAHVNLPAGRRAIGEFVERALNETFLGRFELGGIDHIDRAGFTAHGVVVKDEAGREVLRVFSLRARTDLVAIARELLLPKERIALVIDQVDIERADALLFAASSGSGVPSLARAFTLRPSESQSPGAPPLRVVLPHIQLTRGFVRGNVFGERTLELDVKNVHGAVRAGPERTVVLVRDFATVLRGLGGADLEGTTSFRLRTPDILRTSFEGKLGDVKLSAVVRLDDDELRASFDIPRATPAAVRALFAEYPLHEDVNVSIEGSGKFPLLTLRGSVRSGDGRLLFTGPLRVDSQAATELELDGKNVDLRVALPDAPATRLDFLGKVRVSRAEGQVPTVDVELSTKPTELALTELPAIDASARVHAGEVTGNALVHEPGLPLRTQFKLSKAGRWTFSAAARGVRMERIPRLAGLFDARGRGDLELDGVIDQGKLSGHLTAELSEARTGSIALDTAKLSARFDGSVDALEALELDGDLTSRGLDLGELSFESGAAHISGPAGAPKVEARLTSAKGSNITAEASIGPQPGGVRVSGLSVTVGRQQAELLARARLLDVRDGTINLRELELRGLGGELEGSLEISPALVRARAVGRGLNLAALSGVLGLSTRPRGLIDLDADIELTRDVERGTLRIAAQDVAVGPLDGMSATLNAELEQGSLDAKLDAELPEVGVLEGSLEATLAGSALTRSAYRDMTGELDLSMPEADLALLGDTLATLGVIGGLSGKLSSRVRLSRKDPSALPTVHIAGYTNALAVELPESVLPDENTRRRVSGLDLAFSGEFSGETGESGLIAQLIDSRGALIEGEARGTLDLPALFRAPERFTAVPLTGKVILRERAFDTLPTPLQPSGVRGLIRAEASLTGPLSAPKLSGNVQLGDFEFVGQETPLPLDVCTEFLYEPVSARVDSTGEAFLSKGPGTLCSGARVLRYSLNGSLEQTPQRIVPRGTATINLDGFPLTALPGAADAELSGRAFGSVSVMDHDGTPELAASLELRDAKVQGVAVGTGKLRVQSDVRSVGATLALTSSGGELKGSALAALDRRQGLPRIDTKQPMFLQLTAKRADAVLLSAFLKDVLSEVGGRVDAELSATLATQATPEDPEKLTGSIQGYANVSDGTIQLAGLGLRLNDITLKAQASNDGALTRIRLSELSGIGGRSRDRVRITDGVLWLDGLTVLRASGNLIPEELPLLIEGVEQATARTRQPIPFRLERQKTQMFAEVKIPYLNVALAQSSGRDVIELDENESIEVLQPLGEPTRPSSEGLPWRVRLELGSDVRLTRSDLDLPITGALEARIADEFTLTGDLRLSPGGRLRISDNTFLIESGEVVFNTGEPTDPSLRVAANWRAADDTLVFLTVSGTLKSPRLADPTSSPPKSKQEIWALLMGYSGAGEETGAPGAAGALVGAQQLLSPFFQNTVVQKVSFRASEQELAERNYTTYTAAIPIGDQLWFEGSYHAPSALSRTNLDAQNAVSGTVDWRFRPHWSLRTEVGTIGTGLDLVWQYRY